jgi:hypothetical protein
MIFTDTRLYVQGVGTAIMTDPATGNITYFSDKFQDGNITAAADEGIINAGIGNAPAIMIPTNPNIQVSVTAADYSEYAKAAAVGASVTPGAPVMTCQTVQASGSSISINLASGTPVAGTGMSSPVCYVQKVGAPSPIAQDGVAYPIDAATGAVTGFVAETGVTYLVSYYVSQANASMTTVSTNIKGKVVRFVLQRPIYSNVDSATNQGDLWGMLYEIIPRLQLMPDGAANNGNQNSPTTTAITGRAISYDAETISGGCSNCALPGAPLMYRVIVPCDQTQGIDGILGALGGAVSIPADGTAQLTPATIVNRKLSYAIPPTDYTYESSATSVATVGEHTGTIAGVAEGSAEITVTYEVGGVTYTDFVNVEVTAAP